MNLINFPAKIEKNIESPSLEEPNHQPMPRVLMHYLIACGFVGAGVALWYVLIPIVITVTDPGEPIPWLFIAFQTTLCGIVSSLFGLLVLMAILALWDSKGGTAHDASTGIGQRR